MTLMRTSMPSRSSENVHNMPSLLHIFVSAGHEVLTPDMLVFCGAGTRSACARHAGGMSARPRQHKTGGMSVR